MTTRQEVVNALIDVIGTSEITKVYDWRRQPPRNNEVPCFIVWDLDSAPDYTQSLGSVVQVVNFEIGLFATATTQASEVRYYVNSMLEALGNNPTLNGLLHQPIMVNGVNITCAGDGDVKVVSLITLTCGYLSSVWKL